MSGYIDLHTHLLPGIDDGAETTQDAQVIVDAAKEAGFTTLALTPHHMSGVYESEDEALTEALAGLEIGEGATTVFGREYYLDEHFMAMIEQGALHTIGESNALLVELPMMKIPSFAADCAFRLRLRGYVPLLAHPERYREVISKPARAEELRDKGFLLQVNIGSLVGVYGRKVRKTAETLFKKGLVAVVASDIHRGKHAGSIYKDGIEALTDLVGKKGRERYLSEHPRRLLASDFDE